MCGFYGRSYTMNGEQYKSLVNTFKKQLSNTKALIELADSKMDAIQTNDTILLMEITEKEEKCAREIITLEKIRDAIIKEEEKKQGGKITNIKDVIRLLSPEKSRELDLIAKELKRAMESLKDKNDINAELMTFILEQLEIMNNILIGDRYSQTYSDTRYKNRNGNSETSVFDIKY